MSAEIAEIEAVDLSDLERLDDLRPHLFCLICTPLNPSVAVARCGKWARMRGVVVYRGSVDPGTCEACVEEWNRLDGGCGRCDA